MRLGQSKTASSGRVFLSHQIHIVDLPRRPNTRSCLTIRCLQQYFQFQSQPLLLKHFHHQLQNHWHLSRQSITLCGNHTEHPKRFRISDFAHGHPSLITPDSFRKYLLADTYRLEYLTYELVFRLRQSHLTVLPWTRRFAGLICGFIHPTNKFYLNLPRSPRLKARELISPFVELHAYRGKLGRPIYPFLLKNAREWAAFVATLFSAFLCCPRY